MTVARDLAKYALGVSYQDLSPEVVHATKRIVLDALACAIGGYASDASQITQKLASELDGPKEATIIGSGAKTSCLNAILVNGAMVRFLDFNDTYFVPVGMELTGGHPSDMLPAILSMAERQHAPLKDVITAIVIAYELSARFIEAAVTLTSKTPTMETRGWNADTRGIFVMPIVIGKLLGLTEAQMEQAIGISGCHNMLLGILDASGEEYTNTKNIRFAFTSYSGTLAALLAQKGFTGPTRVLEGNNGYIKAVMGGEFNVAKLLEPRSKFAIVDTIHKSVAADATTHGHVTATLQIVNEHNIKPEDVVAVKITAGERTVEHTGDPVKKYPTNKETADHSSYYLTAIAIFDHIVGPNQYTRAKFEDPKVRALIDKVTIAADPALNQFGAAGTSAITVKSGQTFKACIEYPKGNPHNPMSDAELEEKFRSLASQYMTGAQMTKVINAIKKLDQLKDIGELMKTLVFASKTA